MKNVVIFLSFMVYSFQVPADINQFKNYSEIDSSLADNKKVRYGIKNYRSIKSQSDSNKIFNWAEKNYSQYFSPTGEKSFSLLGYFVRYYKTTDTYIGTKSGELYVYGSMFGGLLPLGIASDWLSLATRNQKMNLDAPTSDKFLITDLVWPSTVGDAHVSLWDGDKIAAVTITIDDNIEEDHAWWRSMQQKYNLEFTWFIIINRVLNWANFQTLIDAGNEVQAHDSEINYDHCKLANATDTKYLTDITLVRDTINQRLTNNQSLTFAYPCGQQRNYLSRDLFIAMRGVTGTMNYANKTNYLNINSRSATNDVNDLDILLFPNETLWNKVFYRGLASYHYHKVTDKTGTEEFLSAVSEKSDSIWVGKFSEVTKYGQERDSHTLTVDEVNVESIKFTLTDEMNDTYFDYPLTVKIRIENNWEGILSIQNGKVVESNIVINNGNSFAIVKAIPDSGQVTISKNHAD